jgi:hypothetical protein
MCDEIAVYFCPIGAGAQTLPGNTGNDCLDAILTISISGKRQNTWAKCLI